MFSDSTLNRSQPGFNEENNKRSHKASFLLPSFHELKVH
jgi:hypothetical protein